MMAVAMTAAVDQESTQAAVTDGAAGEVVLRADGLAKTFRLGWRLFHFNARFVPPCAPSAKSPRSVAVRFQQLARIDMDFHLSHGVMLLPICARPGTAVGFRPVDVDTYQARTVCIQARGMCKSLFRDKGCRNRNSGTGMRSFGTN